jgi:heat shock protein HslJ
MEPVGHRIVQAPGGDRSMVLHYMMTAAATIAVLTGCSDANESSAAESDDNAGQSHDSTDPQGDSGGRIAPADYQDTRWAPLPKYTGGKSTKANLTFLDDGTWTGSDGCNGQSGDYTIAANGHLTADPNPQTLIACPGANINSALGRSDRIALDGDHLILYDGQQVVLEFVEVVVPK